MILVRKKQEHYWLYWDDQLKITRVAYYPIRGAVYVITTDKRYRKPKIKLKSGNGSSKRSVK